jgi:hypothetical protein
VSRWRSLLGLTTPDPTRVAMDIRLSDGVVITCGAPITGTDELDEIERLVTDPRPGYTTIPGHLMDTGARVAINRAHVVSVWVQ